MPSPHHDVCPGCASKDLVIAMLVGSEARLNAHVDSLLAALAEQGVRNFQLQWVAEQEIVARVHTEGHLERVRAKLYRLRDERREPVVTT